MLDAAVQLINMDSDLQSSGTSTSTSPPESDTDCENPRGLVSRPFAKENYRLRSTTKRFNALKFEEQCFHFKEYLRSPDTFRTYPYFIIHEWDKQNLRKKVEHFTWNEHGQKLFHVYNDQCNCGNYIFPSPIQSIFPRPQTKDHRLHQKLCPLPVCEMWRKV